MDDIGKLKEPLKKRFTEEGRGDEPLEPPEELPQLKEVEPREESEEHGNVCVCPQCGQEFQARLEADCNAAHCPECGLSMEVR